MSNAAIPVFDDGSVQRLVPAPEHGSHSDHLVQFYLEETPFLDALSNSLGTALGAGDSAVAVATKVHLDGLARRLGDRGFDVARAIEAGRYIPLEARETLSSFMSDGWPDETRFAEVIGGVIKQARLSAHGNHRHVFAFGEMVAILWAEGKWESALQLERLWNNLAKKYSFTLHCAYPMRAFNREEHGEPFLKICAEHTTVIPSEDCALLDQETSRRNISYLQQKAQALETVRAEREQALKSLLSRDVELADLLENSLEGIHKTGPDQRIQWSNKALLNLLGYMAEEFVGHPLAQFYVHRDLFEKFWARLKCGEDVYDFEAELKCKDGSSKHVLIHCNGLWENGKLVHTRSFIRDVTERKQMELALQLAHEELEIRVNERTQELKQKNLQILEQSAALEISNRGLRNLSARLLQVQDEERRRIARDLHDSTGQSLACLSMNLSALETQVVETNPKLAAGLAENIGIVKQVSTELRTLSYLLHPPLLDEMGLEAALRWYADGFGQRSNIKVNLELPSELERVSRNLEIAIFRVVQECLTNIHLHSGSPTAFIRLTQAPDKITLEIRDEGNGISAERLSKIDSSGLSGVGLRGMRERIKDFQGDMKIVSHEKGTEIRVVVPLAVAS